MRGRTLRSHARHTMRARREERAAWEDSRQAESLPGSEVDRQVAPPRGAATWSARWIARQQHARHEAPDRAGRSRLPAPESAGPRIPERRLVAQVGVILAGDGVQVACLLRDE